MPVSFREDRGCGVLDLEGNYSVREARDGLVQGLADLSIKPPVGLIVDVSRSAMVGTRPSDDIVRAAQGMGPLGHKFSHRIAVVAPSALTFGLMRMGGIHAEDAGLKVRVCHTYESAVAWVLGGSTAE